MTARLADGALGGPDTGFVLVEWTDTGESSRAFPIAPPHRHLEEDEAWYVLEGRLGFRIGEEVVVAGPGEAVLVRRGVFHTYWNDTAGVTRYVLVMGRLTHALVEAIHTMASRDPETMGALFAAHASELAP